MEEIEVKIRIFEESIGDSHKKSYIEFLNGDDGNVYISTDIDQRDLSFNIEQIRLALKKMMAK